LFAALLIAVAMNLQAHSFLSAPPAGVKYRCTAHQCDTVASIGESIAAITGYPATDFLPPAIRSLSSIIYSEDREWVNQARAAAIAKDEPWLLEYRILHADGTTHWVLETAQATFSSASEPIYTEGLLFDISSRKNADAILLQTQQKFIFQMQNIPLALVEWDAQLKVQRWSGQAEKIFGWRADEVLGKHFSDWKFVYEEDIEHVNAAVLQLLQERMNVTCNRNYTKNGAVIYCEWYNSVLFDETDEEIVVTSLVQDVTQRKQAELALQIQAEREKLMAAMTAKIRQTLQLEDVLSTTVKEVRQFLQTDHVVISLFYEDGTNQIVAEARSEERPSLLGQPLHTDQLGEQLTAYQQGSYEIIDNIPTQLLAEDLRDWMERWQIESRLAVPIVSGHQFWGLLSIFHCSQVRYWETYEIELLERLGTQVAIAIQQGQSLQREIVLSKITQRIRQSLNLQEILRSAVKDIQEVLRADRVLIYRFQPDGSGVVDVEYASPNTSSVMGRSVDDPNFQQQLTTFFNQNPGVVISEIDGIDLPSLYRESLAEFGVKSHLILPILQGTSLWGLLALHHCNSRRQWQNSEVDLLQQLTAQMAIAIQQAELYQQLEVANRELAQLAFLDGLTKVGNRRHFDEYLQQEWRRLARQQLPLALIFCDVDNFKPFNDTYGHQAGDECLRQVANAIQESVRRSGDLVARYGGEEFAVILPATASEGGFHIAEVIRNQIKSLAIPNVNSQVHPYITVSLGVGWCIPDSAGSPTTLIGAADEALYQAKAAGRDRTILKILGEHP
jgi:diguanylate cyclase (GGDEF)-like protein/PAS domain S-box-containing protein